MVGTGADHEPTTFVDQQCEAMILKHLYNIPMSWEVLSEEKGIVESRKKGTNLSFKILIDPVDATGNALIGFPSFSTSIAVFEENEIICGWIYDPLRDIQYYAYKGHGAFLKLERTPRRIFVNHYNKKLSDAVIGLMRPKTEEEYTRAKSLFLKSRKIRSLSCSSLEMAYVASGVYDAFLDLSNPGWEKDCDFAAAFLLIKEAGGIVVTLDGKPIKLRWDSISLKKRRNLIACSTEELAYQIIYSISGG